MKFNGTLPFQVRIKSESLPFQNGTEREKIRSGELWAPPGTYARQILNLNEFLLWLLFFHPFSKS